MHKMFGMLMLISSVYICTVDCVYYNVTINELAKCREYDATSGYGYQTYFKIDDVNNNFTDGHIVNLKLYVLGSKDAHILLSTAESPSTVDPVYEIVLGGGGNTFSEIRRKRKTQALQSIRRKSLLSPLYPLPITIKISQNGSIEVGVVGESLPLLNLTDKNPLQIKYISFSTWGTAETRFFYDCQTDHDNSDELDDTKGANLSASSKLALSLFSNEIVNSDNARNISIEFQLHQISYHSKDGMLSTKGKFNLQWRYDQELWEPEEYDGMKYLTIRNLASWHGLRVPPILLLNSKDSSFSRGFNSDFKLTVHFTGEVYAESTDMFSMNTMCSDISNAHDWPMDEINCDIQLGIISEIITLIPVEDNAFKIENNNYDQSEWHLKDVHLKRNFTSATTVGMTDFNPVEIVYSLTMKRSTLFYHKIFCGPLLGSFTFILLSFWTKRFVRASLNLSAMLILTIMLAVSMDYSPKSYVPQLLKYYQISIYLSWFAFFLFIITCWAEQITTKIQPFAWLAKCMQFTWLRLLIGLDIPNNYNHLDREDVSWASVNLFFNRIVFFIYFIFLLIGMMNGI